MRVKENLEEDGDVAMKKKVVPDPINVFDQAARKCRIENASPESECLLWRSQPYLSCL